MYIRCSERASWMFAIVNHISRNQSKSPMRSAKPHWTPCPTSKAIKPDVSIRASLAVNANQKENLLPKTRFQHSRGVRFDRPRRESQMSG